MFNIIITTHYFISKFTISIIDPSTTTKEAGLNVWVYQTEEIAFEEEMSLSSKPQIKPLLSGKSNDQRICKLI